MENYYDRGLSLSVLRYPLFVFSNNGVMGGAPRQNGQQTTENESGFTILELSIVLAIISLVTAMAVSSGIAIIATARQSATMQKMAAIEKALMAFRVANDRIPCPADMTIPPGATNYGVEAVSPSASTNASSVASGQPWSRCTNGGAPQANLYSLNAQSVAATGSYGKGFGAPVAAAEGGVPTVALGLPNDFMYDGWGNRIRYAVDVNMTTAGSFSAMPAGALCGPITVCDSGGVSSGACVNTARSSGAIYALISHGANGYGAYTQNGVISTTSSDNANEQINCHYTGGACPTLVSGTPQTFSPIYVQQSPSTSSTDPLNVFDDIVTYKERWQMQTAWDKQGAVCPSLWVFDTAGGNVRQYDMNGNLLNFFFDNESPNSPDNLYDNPVGGEVDANGNLWMADPGEARVVELSSSGQWMMTIGGGVNTPGDNDLNCSGYATSSSTAAPLSGTTGYCGQEQTTCWCNTGTSNGMFNFPENIAIDRSGNIWVVDRTNNRVQEFNSNGQWLLTIGGGTNYTAANYGITTCTAGTCTAGSHLPANCVPCTSTNTLWGSSRSCVCTAGGGNGNGMFNFPQSITIDPSGNIWVGDYNNQRVQEFNSNGQWLKTVGGDGNSGTTLCTKCVSGSSCTCALGTNNGQVDHPRGLTSDPGGNLWVADLSNNRVQEFSNTANFLLSIGGSGGPPGTCTTSPAGSPPACPVEYSSGGFDAPLSVAVDASGNLWAGDLNGVQKFSNIGGVWTSQPTGSIYQVDGSGYGIAIAR